MPMNLDAYLGVHQDALKIRGQRTEVLARNLANADTPGYKARDHRFPSRARAGERQRRCTHRDDDDARESDRDARRRQPVKPTANLKYRNPLAPSLDGNTVDVQMEQANFAENSVRFQATLSFLNARFRGLMTAITGQ